MSHDELSPLQQELFGPVLEELSALRDEVASRDELRGALDVAKVLGLPEQAAYSLKQLEKHLGLHYETLREEYHAGNLKGRNLNGNKIVIFRWSVLEWLGLPASPSKAVIRLNKRADHPQRVA